MPSLKEQAIAAIIAAFEERYQRALGAAGEAAEYATDEDSAAEGKYDTRSLEASYLAAGQAEQAEALAESLALLKSHEFPEFEEDDPISSGALVEAEFAGDIVYFLLVPAGGGTTTTLEGLPLTALSPETPLYQQMLGLRCGDPDKDGGLTVYTVS